ncbi:MAG: hypothetical protein P1V81_14235 [Planctomycetota bacterium]|nr:hypothetical protein [Planctomycetota bacterium]
MLAALLTEEPETVAGALAGRFTAWDWLVVLGFLALTTWIGHRMSGKQASIRDFFLGGRSLPWYAVSASIIATEISAVTFISLPSVVAKDGGNFTYLQLGLIGGLIARSAVAFWLVPAYYEREILSPYDYMAEHLGGGARKVVTWLFAIGGVLGQSARVYLTALVLGVLLGPELAAVEATTGVPPLVASVAAIALVAVAWTWMGGIAAVVWTDAILFLVFLAGIVIAISTVAVQLDGGVVGIAQDAWAAGKFRMLDFDTSLTNPYTFWAALFAVSFWSTGQYGTDQLMAQRFFCCKGEREAKMAVLFAYAAMGVTLLVGFVGASLWAWYAAHPMEGAAAALYAERPDRIFAIFLVEEVPVGLKGLVIAGVFATAISSLDSILAALSQTVLSAFYLPRRERELASLVAAGQAPDPGQEESEARRTLALSRKLVLGFAVLLAVVAVYMDVVAEYYRSILDLALAMATYTAGALLAGFALAFFRVTERRGLDASGYTWSAPLSMLAVFSVAWHQPLAQAIVLGLALAVAVVWLGVRLRAGRLATARELGQTALLFGLLAAMVLAARFGFWSGAPIEALDGPTGELVTTIPKISLSFVWYPLIGGLVAFLFGWWLSDPRDPEVAEQA